MIALAACGSGGSAVEEPVEAQLAGFTVRVQSDPARMVVTSADGAVLIDGLPGGPAGAQYEPPLVAAAFRAATATYEMQVGSFRIEETRVDPWAGAPRFTELRAEADAIAFAIDGGGVGRIAAAGDGHLTITLTGPDTANRASWAFGCDPDEHFLGFGGQTAAVDHRGDTVPLWVSEDGITKVDTDFYDVGIWFLHGRLHSTHTPMPMYVSSRGYGLLLDTPYRSIFAMCSEGAGDAVRVEAWERELRAHVFYGPSPREVVERMTAHVGRPELPPAFAFAPWLDAIFGEDNVRRVATALRDADVPSAVIWSEDWRGASDDGIGYVLDEDWEVDRELYPNFEQLAGELHDLGFKLLIYHNSFLDARVPAHAEAKAGGYTIQDDSGEVYLFTGVKFEDSTLLDLSNPEARAWAKQKYRDSLELGADGYMADFAEWLPTDAVLHEGDALAAHNLYPVEWARLNKELFDEMYADDGIERLFFVRSAYVGSQPLVSVVWAGDQQTDFTPDDGMASVVPIGIGLGMTGFPYFGHDIAGYMSQLTEPVTRELWFRWVTFGALSPVMRTHHGREARMNWNWESDAESTAHFARWARLHQQLFPYLYAMAAESAATGAPMFRPLAFDYPAWEPGWSLMDQYMLGDRIVVAPVFEPGATARDVALPDGTFYPLLGGPAVQAGELPAAVDEIIALVPAGTLLALLPPDVDTVVAADPSTGVVTMADAADDRELWLWPGGQSELTEVGGLRYTWTATSLTGPITSATFNGNPVTIAEPLELTGPGTLVLNGGDAELVIEDGAADRAITVRVRGL